MSRIVLNRPLAGRYYQTLFEAAGETPDIRATVSSTEMVRSMVGAGQGAAILNMLPKTDVSYGGDRLVALPISDPLPALTLSVGYNTERPRRLVQVVATALKTYFAGPDGARRVISDGR